MKVRVMGRPEEISQLKAILKASDVLIDCESNGYCVRGSKTSVRAYFDITIPTGEKNESVNSI